jgi:hypothetical protein
VLRLLGALFELAPELDDKVRTQQCVTDGEPLACQLVSTPMPDAHILVAAAARLVGMDRKGVVILAIEAESALAMCYSASMRPGRTRTTSFSLDEATLKNLKALASRRHKGNVSALLAEIAAREATFAAAEAYFEKYGIPPLSQKTIDRIEAEWRGEAPSKKARRREV